MWLSESVHLRGDRSKVVCTSMNQLNNPQRSEPRHWLTMASPLFLYVFFTASLQLHATATCLQMIQDWMHWQSFSRARACSVGRTPESSKKTAVMMLLISFPIPGGSLSSLSCFEFLSLLISCMGRREETSMVTLGHAALRCHGRLEPVRFATALASIAQTFGRRLC